MFRALCFIVFAILACLPRAALATDPAPFILVDQFGYLPELEKRAIIRDPVEGFDAARQFAPGNRYAVINTDSGQVVFEGRPVAWKGGKVDPNSGDRVWHFDFTAVKRPGRYVVRDLERGVNSDVFDISATVYRPVLRDAFKAFYYQRAGFEKREPYVARGYADKASHLGKGQDPQATRFDAEGDLATARDLRGGWYDAGDYNQYTSWTANYISSLLASYAENPKIWTDSMGIPESSNGIPDVLDEVRWGLAWLKRMQNQDGSLLSVLSRDEASPPSKADGPSRYGLANTSATVTAAGTFAMAADIFRDHPALKGEVEELQRRSALAWRWVNANPNVKFYNNSDEHGTGGLAAGQQEVEADRLIKKRLIAATQIYRLTREQALLREIERMYRQMGGIKPDTANGFEGDIGFTLLNFATVDGVPARLRNRIRRDYTAALKAYNGWPVLDGQDDPYGAPVDGYWWGSNGTKSRRGSVYAQAVVGGVSDRSSMETINVASHYLHYLHGVNPMGLVYLTNMDHAGAERSASTLYHAWFKDGSALYDSAKTSKYGPAPGLMVGGANESYKRDACCATGCPGFGAALCRRPIETPPAGQPPAKSYGEFNEGWPINSWEVTENSLGYQSDYIRLLSKFVR
jgi:hypothetical protein